MSKRRARAINIGVLVLILGYLFAGLYTRSPWIEIVVVGLYFLGAGSYFIVQLIRHRGGDERARARWIGGPGWWRRFSTDDYERPKK